MKNEKMTKKEIRETFEDIQFCLKKLENHAHACKNPNDVGMTVLCIGATLNEIGFSDRDQKYFNFAVGDSVGLMAGICTMIEMLDQQGVSKSTVIDFINHCMNIDEDFEL